MRHPAALEAKLIAPTTPPPTAAGTLAQPHVAQHLGWFAQASAHAERLLALYRLQPEADEMHLGHCALQRRARELRELAAAQQTDEVPA